MSLTINLANKLTAPENYISQAYKKSRDEGMKAREKEDDPKARAVKVEKPAFEHQLGESIVSTKKADEDAVVVELSTQKERIPEEIPSEENAEVMPEESEEES